MAENSLSLVDLNNRLATTREYIIKLIGEKTDLKPITDEIGMNAAQENAAVLLDIKNKIVEYFKPVKAEARKPWDELCANEREYLDDVEMYRDHVNAAIKAYNNKLREEIRIREQKEADERAEKKRAELEALKVQAAAAGNEAIVAEIEQEKQAVIAAPVAEKQIMNRNAMSTMSEKKIIEDFKITDQFNFVNALIGSGLGALIVLDVKTVTAFKKYLLANESVNEFPGCNFRRDYDVIQKRKASVE